MSKYEKIGISLSALAVIGILFLIFNLPKQEKTELGGGIQLQTAYIQGRTATTSETHLNTANATTTFAFTSGSADMIDLNFLIESTSTVPTLVWFYEFANATTCSSNYLNCDWHPQDGNTVASEIQTTHGANPHLHYWTPAATTSVGELWRKNVQIEPTASQYIRVNFNTTGADIDLWAEAVMRNRTR